MTPDLQQKTKCPFCYAWNKQTPGRKYECEDCGRTFSMLRPDKGARFTLAGKKFIVSRNDNHPFLPIRHGFAHESMRHPELTRLRRKYHMDRMIDPAIGEYANQRRFRQWICDAFTSGQPSVPSVSKGGPDPDVLADVIIAKAREFGNTYFCTYKALCSVQLASAFGWTARLINTDGYNGPFGRAPAGHMVYEMWSNELNKWYFNDSLFNFHVEKDGIPLSAREIREEFFRNNGRDICIMWGPERDRLPGEMRIHRGAWKCEWYVVYMHNNFLDFPPGDHIHPLLMPRDRHNAGKRWRRQPSNTGNVYVSKGMVHEESDPYHIDYPLNQTEIMLVREKKHLLVKLHHNMPNFDRLEIRFGGRGAWTKVVNQRRFEAEWIPSQNRRLVEARCVNTREVSGPVSRIEICPRN